MNNRQIVELTHHNLVDIYGCLPIALVRGSGAYLEDADGNRYLDFFCGLAVTNLGHCHPRVVKAIREQSERLMHVSSVSYRADPRIWPHNLPGALATGASLEIRRGSQ